MELGTPRHALSSRWDQLKRNKPYHSVGWILDKRDEYCMTLRRFESLMRMLNFIFLMLLYTKDSFRRYALFAMVSLEGNMLLDQQSSFLKRR